MSLEPHMEYVHPVPVRNPLVPGYTPGVRTGRKGAAVTWSPAGPLLLTLQVIAYTRGSNRGGAALTPGPFPPTASPRSSGLHLPRGSASFLSNLNISGLAPCWEPA